MSEYIESYIRTHQRESIDVTKEEKKYVLYLRKSSKDKDKQVQSIKDQRKDCYQYAKREKIRIERIFEESQSAMISEGRDAFKEMMEEIKKGTYNSILAWHPDRLARNMKDAGEIIDLLDKKILMDLKFPSYTFVNNGSGKLALGVQFVLAKNYSDNLSVVTKRGNHKRFEDGEGIRSNKYGYKLVRVGDAKKI